MDISIEKLKTVEDNRGVLVELLTNKEVRKNKSFGHLFFATFKDKKAIRGNHYHEIQHEYYTVISGEIRVIMIDVNTRRKRTIILSQGDREYKRLRIGPGVAHASYCLTENAVLVSYYRYPYDPKNPDTKKFEVISKR